MGATGIYMEGDSFGGGKWVGGLGGGGGEGGGQIRCTPVSCKS